MTKESSHEFGASVESVILSHEDHGKASRVFESPVGPITISHDVGSEVMVPTFSIPVHEIQPSDIRIETYTEGVIVSSDVKVEPFYEIKVEEPSEDMKVEPSEDKKVETYTCDFCDKQFTWKGNLEMHLVRIHEGEGKKFTCSLCGKQFIHENSLKIHKRLHSYTFEEEHSNGRAPDPTPQTSKNVQTLVNLQNGSINEGLQEKPPSQPPTKSATNPPKTKESDIKSDQVYDYHSVSKVTPEFHELDAKIKAKVIEYREKNEFTCKDCDFFTKNRCNMYNHVEAKHVTHDGVKCQICNKMCSTRLSHRVHLIVGHKVQVRAKKQ